MSKLFKRVTLGVLCAILVACAVAVGTIFGLNSRANNNLSIADGASDGSHVSATTGSLGADNKTDYVVSLSGSATEMAKQWKTAMGYNGSVTVILKDNWTASGGSFGSCDNGEVGFGSTGGLVIPSNKTVVLNMNGFNINRGLSSATADGAVITVEANASLIINGSGNISGGYNSAAGGGITSEGDVTINGATITGNKTIVNGAGVRVKGATLTMTSGTVTSNQFIGASDSTNGIGSGGGVILSTNATFNMSGGTISNNTAGRAAGVFVYMSMFNMTGGIITGNNNTGTEVNDGGGGVGVSDSSTFNFINGSIKDNVSYVRGGGVFVDSTSTFNMSGGTLSGHHLVDSTYGGSGVLCLGTFNLSGGTISGNACQGGAINVFGTMTMTGGNVINNPDSVYGIYLVEPPATINLNGGLVSGNTNGVYIERGTTVSVGGPIHITGNTNANLYLGNAVKVNITTNLSVWDSAQIGVTTYSNNVAFTSGYLARSGMGTTNRADRIFFPDKDTLIVQYCTAAGAANSSGPELRLTSGTPHRASWTAVINGVTKNITGSMTCYYGDVISSVTGTVGSSSWTWTPADGFTTNTAEPIQAYSSDPNVFEVKDIGYYFFFLGNQAMPSTSNTAYRELKLAIMPRPITITIDSKTSKFGESLDTLTGSITSGTLANGDSIDDLGITYTKTPGDSVGKYSITGTATNANYDVTFVYGTYEITSTSVSIVINDQVATYGSKYYALTKTENNTPWAAVGTITTDDSGNSYDSEGYLVDSDGDRINDNGDKLYNGGWRYADDTSAKFEASDLASSTRYPLTITCSGTGFTDITSTANTAYIAVGKYFINYVASPNYNITFTSNNTNGAADTQGVFEIKGATITVKAASVYDSENLYDSADYDGNQHNIVIPAGAITLKGDVTSATVKSVVFASDDTTIPTETPKADDTSFWTSASTTPQKKDAGTYKVYSLISATNHETLVYVWTFKIGASGAEFELTAKHGTTTLTKDDSGAYKVTYDGVAVTVSINFKNSGVNTTNCPVLIFYKGTNSGNTYGADTDNPDESKDKDGNALGLGNKTAPKDAGTYQATVIADPSATSGYELDSTCDSTFTFTIEAKKIAKPTAAFANGSGTYNGNTQTVNYTYDTAAVKITAYSGLTDDEGNAYKDLALPEGANDVGDASSENTSTKQTTSAFSGKAAGNYAVKFDLTSTRNYKWDDEDNPTGAQIVSCTVAKAKLDFDLVSPVKSESGTDLWQWDAGTTADNGISAKENSLKGLVDGDTVTFNVYWYKFDSNASGNPTLKSVQSGISYDALNVDISTFTEQATYYILIQVAAGSASNSNDNYCLSEDDTNFTPDKLEGVKLRKIVIDSGKVDVSKIIWKWQLEGSGADPAKYVTNAENADDNTKLVYTTKTVSGAITAVNYVMSADLSDLDYLELDTSKGTGGYENFKNSAAGEYTLKLYVKIKNDSSYEFDTDSTDYDADSATTACVEFKWVINKKVISFVDDDGNSLVKWAYFLSDGSDIPAVTPGSEADNEGWTVFSDKNNPTYTGESVYVKISDDYLKGLGFTLSDVRVSYASNSKSTANSEQTTTATVQISGDTAKNYQLASGSVPAFKWTIGNTKITISGWDDEVGRDLDDGNGHVYTLPGVKIDAEDDDTAKKLAGYIEYKYSYTFTDADGNTVTRTDVDEDKMMEDLFAIADQNGQPINITVKAELSDEGNDTYAIEFDSGVENGFTSSIGDSKIKVYVSLENETAVYGDVSLNLAAVYYNDNDMSNPARTFDGQYLEVTVTTADGTYTFKLSEISNYVLYIKDAGEYKLTFKIDDNRKETYKLGNSSVTFTVLPKPIAVPQITGEIVFAGQNIELKDYLDANYKAYSDDEIVQWTVYATDCYDAGTYTCVLTIVNTNYVWADIQDAENPAKATARYTVADNVIGVSNGNLDATYSWEIKPYVLSSSLWNLKGKEGASLNLPDWVAAMMSGENPTLGIKYSYRTDKASPEVEPEWKGGNSYFVNATLNGADAKNFAFESGSVNSSGDPVSEMVTYTVPQSGAAAFFSNVGSFVKKNWLWFVIGAAILLFLILLIIIIAVAKKKKKKKEAEAEAKKEKEEAKAAAATAAAPMLAMSASMADEKAKLEAEKAKMEAELAKAKMEAEAEAAKAKAQAELDLQKAKMEAELAKIRAEAEAQNKQAQQAQQPAQQPAPAQQPVQQAQPQYQQAPQFMPMPQFMPQPQYMPQPQTDNGALARLEEEFKSMRAEQRSDTKLENEMLKLRLDMSRNMPNQYGYVQNNQLPAGQQSGLTDSDVNSFAEKLGILMASMMRNMGVKAMPIPEKSEPQVIEAESQSGAVNTPTMYPPDAVITTTTTVDTTNRVKPVSGGDRRDDSLFDIDGFYDKFDESK